MPEKFLEKDEGETSKKKTNAACKCGVSRPLTVRRDGPSCQVGFTVSKELFAGFKTEGFGLAWWFSSKPN